MLFKVEIHVIAPSEKALTDLMTYRGQAKYSDMTDYFEGSSGDAVLVRSIRVSELKEGD